MSWLNTTFFIFFDRSGSLDIGLLLMGKARFWLVFFDKGLIVACLKLEQTHCVDKEQLISKTAVPVTCKTLNLKNRLKGFPYST